MNKIWQLVVVLMILLLCAIVLSNNYREFIYSNQINDFGIADAGGNFLVVPILAIILTLSGHRSANNQLTLVLKITLFYVGTEFLSLLFPYIGVFDIADLIAYIFGAIFTVYLFKWLKLNEYNLANNNDL